MKRLQTLWQLIKTLGATAKAHRPSAKMTRGLLVALGMVALCATAFFLGRNIGPGEVLAQNPGLDIPGLTHANYGNTNGRVVAYIFGNVPVSREELGEYLIERFGKERTEFLVNRKIVEMACHKRNIFVTDQEIESQIDVDLQSFGQGLSRKDFEGHILRRFNKTLFEWREDVVRPKLLLAKLVRPNITVSEDDMTKAFEAKYHDKVQCRMIVFQNNDTHAWAIYNKVKDSEAEFAAAAKSQFLPNLQANGGEIPPIHKHFGDPRIEKEAFSLKDGQVSALLQMPDKTCLILKRDKLIPQDTTVRLDQPLRLKLHQEIFDYKLAMEIPQMFNRLRQEANPQIILGPNVVRQADMMRSAQEQMNDTRQVMHQSTINAPPPPPEIGPPPKAPKILSNEMPAPSPNPDRPSLINIGPKTESKSETPATPVKADDPPPLSGNGTAAPTPPAILPSLGTNPPAPATADPKGKSEK